MARAAKKPTDFEATLTELEQIVTRLESGDLSLEEALSAFERGIVLTREGQQRLTQAEQRVQILLSNAPNAALTPFSADSES
ncbi:MAG: exodeoxyribonuclease VII small subunit [Plesiomonas sp.]|uniref:exodeoxyribonuclease VII small subunit n=1 Tax=Plesiomonas sp. TaxID=2486279 RepID=UPI003EE42E05